MLIVRTILIIFISGNKVKRSLGFFKICDYTMEVNVSGGSRYENIEPHDMGFGQDIEFIVQETGINPVEILVAPLSARNIHV